MSDDLDILLPGPPAAVDSWRWGTVTGTGPLRVRLDGDGAALAVTPDSLVGQLLVGQRAWCQIVGNRVVVHGPTPGLFAMAAGVATISAGFPTGVVDVTLPAGRFTVTPVVTVTTDSGQHIAHYVPGVSSSSSIRLGLRSVDEAWWDMPRQVYWTAAQMTPVSAAG